MGAHGWGSISLWDQGRIAVLRLVASPPRSESPLASFIDYERHSAKVNVDDSEIFLEETS